MTTRPLSVKSVQQIALTILLGWTSLVVVIFFYILHLEIRTSLVDASITNSLLALGCIVISNILGYYQPRSQTTLYVLFVSLLITLVIVSLNHIVLDYLIPDAQYQIFLRLSLPIRFLIFYIFLCWSALANILWYKLEEQTYMQERLHQAENLAKEAELNKLRHQLQPHFLFNSLNSVFALTIINPKEAGTMITKLAAFLRGTLKRDDDTWITVEEEMEYIQLYLDIEKVRFSHRLQIKITIDEQSLEMKLPGTILQPVIENAIKFGLYNTSEAITITIDVQVQNQMLKINVKNPYDPAVKTNAGTGFGLSAIRRRLYLLFADNNLIITEATPDKYFITTISIPQHDKNHTN
jgi:two-component system LytT family sensor kinase